MANFQNNPATYAKAIQFQLESIVTPVPVYVNFNRNYATEPKFITWQLRNVHQDVYTGVNQGNKGTDRPVFQMSIFCKTADEAFNLMNTILQSLHGYSGQFGGVNGIWIGKADVVMQYHTYDNDIGLQQVIMDCTLDIPN